MNRRTKDQLRLLERLVLFGRSHRIAILLFMLMIIGAGGFGLARLKFHQDMLRLLPLSQKTFADYRTSLEVFEPQDVMHIAIKAESSSVPLSDQQLMSAADKLYLSMNASKKFRKITYRVDESLFRSLVPLFLEKPFLYYQPNDYQRLQNELSEPALRKTLTNWLEQLQSSPSPYLASMFSQDPLHLSAPSWRKLEQISNFKGHLQIKDGRLFAANGQYIVMIAYPVAPASRADFSKALVTWMDDQVVKHQQSGVHIAYLCGHRFSSINAGMIREDVERATSVSLIALVILVLGVFRRRLFLLYAFIPMLLATCFVFFSLSLLFNDISLIALACGSILFGVAVDYAIHIFYDLDQNTVLTSDTILMTVRHLMRPLIISCLTTIAAFACLWASDLPVYREFALVAAIGLLASLVFTMLILAIIPFDFVKAAHVSRLTRLHETLAQSFGKILGAVLNLVSRHPRFSLIMTVVLTVLLGFAIPRLKFSGDLRDLYAKSPKSAADAAEIEVLFAEVMASTSVIVRAPSAEQLLNNTRAVRALIETEFMPSGDVDSVFTPLDLFVSEDGQRQAFQKWRDYWTDKQVDQLKQNFARAAASVHVDPHLLDRTIAAIATPTDRPLSLIQLQQAGLAELSQSNIKIVGQEYFSLTSLRVSSDAAFDRLKARLVDQAIVASSRDLIRHTLKMVYREFQRLGLMALGAIVLVLFLSFPWIAALVASLPIVLSIFWTLGLLAWMQIPINIMNCVVSLLVVALTVDFSVFLTDAYWMNRDQPHSNAAHKSLTAITISVLTTLIGVAGLVFAQHPALRSIGMTIFIATCFSLVAVLVCIPMCAQLWSPRRVS